jgi:hydrogenase maturation protease
MGAFSPPWPVEAPAVAAKLSRAVENPVLLIGYGNELRCDDALGPTVARALAALGFGWLRVLAVPQLTPELAEPVSRARAVVFVDATLNAPPGAVQIGPLAGAALSEPLGHLGSPRSLLALAEAVFQRVPPAWMVTVGVEELGAGEGLSPAVERALPEVVESVRALLVRLSNRRPSQAPTAAAAQLELHFARSARASGLDSWQAQRRAALEELADKLALPLNHLVEVWFRDGVRLRGRMVLRESPLFIENLEADKLELEIDGVVFRAGDIESFVRLD